MIRFTDTNPRTRQFFGRVEHVATGKTLRFDSMPALIDFMTGVLTEVRANFEQADTLAEEFPKP